ncbi:hypothetical protein [Lederbergia galactosidilytica]|uniref:Uncharacterized protein n=1 Tax=Lederbergia galactosidilytica TaxID=217031 RepID=A0A178A4B2_9BACI|nr:hypothetical protein [Lederbergia galactosidilytica]OAK74679.1 hypothetical protein ABB05_03690 [Lederbergia galactosidilytica]
MQRKFFSILFMLLLILMVLTGCTMLQNDFVSPEVEKNEIPPIAKENEKEDRPDPRPFQFEANDEFEKIYGWIDDQTIIYGFMFMAN